MQSDDQATLGSMGILESDSISADSESLLASRTRTEKLLLEYNCSYSIGTSLLDEESMAVSNRRNMIEKKSFDLRIERRLFDPWRL